MTARFYYNAVNKAIEALVPIIAGAPLDEKGRADVLERLWDALQEDEISYIESVGDHWGELCASPKVASEWADGLIGTVRLAWSPDPSLRGFFYLATFRALARKYPHLPPEKIPQDLADSTPGEEGKWFAAAKDAGLFDKAIELAWESPPDPRTLARAARDFAEENPAFAIEAGMAALHWLVQGFGYEVSNIEVRDAYAQTMRAAEAAGRPQETRERIEALVAGEIFGEPFVTRVLVEELGLS